MECEKILKRIQSILWKGVEESETFVLALLLHIGKDGELNVAPKFI